MKDRFEDFLEDTLSGPDLELGHEMRRRLLEAAVAGEGMSGGNVVPLDRADPDEAAGFDWLVGESPATTLLMGRMVHDPGFLETLDGQRCFLRTLRRALGKTAAAATVVPARRRWVPAAVLSAAAAFALAAGAWFFQPGGTPAAVQAAASPAEEASGPPATSGSPHPGEAAPVVVAVAGEKESGFESSGAPEIPGMLETVPDEAPALADLSGTGRSVAPEDPLMVPGIERALELAAGDSPVPGPLMAALGGGLEESDSLEIGGPLASLSGDHSGWQTDGFGNLGGATGPSLAGEDEGDRESIPEPGTALPVMLGLLVLLLQRERGKTATGKGSGAKLRRST